MTKQTAAEPVTSHYPAKGLWAHLKGVHPLVLLTSPLIYACVIPFALLDLFVAVYQAVCFPVNGIPRVRRRDYLIFDRARLPYLNSIEKLGCLYCSYANGLLAYVREIAARTEQHFCPIRHAAKVQAPHSRYPHFLPYGDARAYRAHIDEARDAFTDIRARGEARERKPDDQ
jgi:hypothetical protein